MSADAVIKGGPAFRHIGKPLPRKEDQRFITGHGRFLDDIAIPHALQAVFVRSPHAHARIRAIVTQAAAAHPGIVAVATGRDLATWTKPLRVAPPIEGLHPTGLTTLPIDKVRFQGDPVACIVASDGYSAQDAAESLVVEYDELPAVTHFAAALAPGAPLVDESLPSNLVSHQVMQHGDVEGCFRAAHRIVTARFAVPRLTHAPIETRGCAAIWDEGREHLTFHIGTQVPHPLRTQLAARLDLAESQVTVISPDVGGGFGQKIALYREELCVAALARALRRPVRWRETRMENLQAASHARDQTCRVAAAVAADGAVLALKLEIDEDFGAYCFYPANYIARVIAMILTGPYRIDAYGYEIRVALTNKCGAGPMRAPMAMTSWVMEGTMDAIARDLGLDPLAVRRRNMLQQSDLPYMMTTGEILSDVTPAETLETAVTAIDYADFRQRQAEARHEGRYLGLGLCTVVESTTYGSRFYRAAGIPGSGHESAWVRVEPSGAVNASVGLMGTGQGYETPLAQAVAEGLGVRPQDVRVLLGNTDIAPYGMGSRGGRGATAGGGVLFKCGQKARAHVLSIAAHLLSLNSASELRMVDGDVERRLGGHWTPTGLSLAQIARTAYLDPLALPEGMMPGLDFSLAYDPPAMTYSNATHACIVEFDPTTGAVAVERYLAVEDCGTVLNPIVVRGQQHGAIAMGLSGALFEQIVYDEAGQNLTSSFTDYAMPCASDLPAIEIIPQHTPSTRTPAGIKGMSEGGVMGAIGALGNAVNDALAPFGVVAECQPFLRPVLYRLMRDRKPDGIAGPS